MNAVKGYSLVTEFRTDGAGRCQWAFAEKDGKQYFIKKFLSPKYPSESSAGSQKQKEARRGQCDQFERDQKALLRTVQECAKSGSNLVVPEEIFREGKHYYKVSPRIDVSSIPFEELHKRDKRSPFTAMLTALQNISVLHSGNIVHGDIKPENILLKDTETGSISCKLIDFDDSFFSGEPPDPNSLVGDQRYFAPEASGYIQGADVAADDLTCKADIFALGIVLAQIVSGQFPDYDESETFSLGDAVRRGATPRVNSDLLPEEGRSLIESMLRSDPAERPTAFSALERLKRLVVPILEGREKSLPHSEEENSEKPRLKGRAGPKRVSADDPGSADKTEGGGRGLRGNPGPRRS